ncbi:MAG: AAA family ATPase [Bradyrhizobiaceae bacterium]|nr:AAA family ATPase [Bradyrhizobiaceae bacterium]
MKVREFTVTNFRGFDGERRFPVSDRVTVVAGVNGRGKTSVLDGMALVISRLFRSLGLSSGNQRTISAADVHGECQDASLEMRVHCAGVPLDFSVAFRPDSKIVRASPITPAVKREITHNYGDPSRADDQAPIAVYYTTDRAGLRLPRSLPTDLPSGQQLAHNGALSNRMVDYRDFIARYRVWQSQGRSKELRAFETALGVFLDGFSKVEVEVDPLRITVQKQGHRLALNQLSDGERSFIAVIGDMVRRLALANPDLDDPLQGHGVVLIDELELHLHPKWQREVLQGLRQTFPNIQFIGTTHSPFVIQSLEPGELVNLDPDDSEYADRSLEDIAEEVMGVELPQKSARFKRMYDAAREYYGILESAAEADEVGLQRIKDRLDELSMPFSRDPAYQAFLEFQRNRALGEDDL